MTTAIQLGIAAAWLLAGLFIVRRSRVAGQAVLWMFVLGPLGLLLVAYGERQRHRAGVDDVPKSEPLPPNLSLPVEVHVDQDVWSPGVLHTWSTKDLGLMGWVTFTEDGQSVTDWVPAEMLRRSDLDGSSPVGETLP